MVLKTSWAHMHAFQEGEAGSFWEQGPPPKLSILPLWCFCPLPAYVHYGQFHLDTNRGRLIIKSALPLMG